MEKLKNNPIWQVIMCVEKGGNITGRESRYKAAKRELDIVKGRINIPSQKAMKYLETFLTAFRNGQDELAKTQLDSAKDAFEYHLVPYYQQESHPTKGDNGDQVRGRQSRQDVLYRQHENVSGPVYDGTRSYSNKNPSSSINYKDADKNNSGKHDYRKEDVDTSDVVRRRQPSGSEDPNYANFQRRKRASQKMVQNNPEIPHLSDVNRPTKIAENFSELYDNEWTEAFEVIRSTKLIEKDIITLLLDIVEEAYMFCLNEADKQIDAIELQFARILTGETSSQTQPNPSGRILLVQYRKTIAERAIERIQRNFRLKLNEICKQNLSTEPAEGMPTIKFAQRALELCWWMCVQDPPVHMCLTKRELFNPALYKAYMKSGSEPDYFVWPALKLYRDGGVLSKGVAQFK